MFIAASGELVRTPLGVQRTPLGVHSPTALGGIAVTDVCYRLVQQPARDRGLAST